MSLRILIGHEKPGQRGTATALYVGSSGAELELAKATATCGSFSILNNPPALRKSNPNYSAASTAAEKPAAEKPAPRRKA